MASTNANLPIIKLANNTRGSAVSNELETASIRLEQTVEKWRVSCHESSVGRSQQEQLPSHVGTRTDLAIEDVLVLILDGRLAKYAVERICRR